MKHYMRWAMVLAVAFSAALPLLGPGGALAATPHENPETATPVFSGIALFQYYSHSLDAVLLKDASVAEARLSKLPWANVPERLTAATGDFATSGTSLTRLVTQMHQDMNRLNILVEQSRLDEAVGVVVGMSGNLTAARSELTRLERAVTTSGREFRVAAAPEGSDLKASYQQVLDRISRIREMLSLFRQLLVSDVEATERTEITLSVDRMTAFVGDSISFQGMLTSARGPLVQRDVDILLNSSSYVTVRTDAAGHYQGTLEIPYWYQPGIEVQALYYPRDVDRGTYLASLSPIVRFQVQYYTAKLEVEPEAKAYPGRATTFVVRFDYGTAPVPATRKVEVYFDGDLIQDMTLVAVESTLTIDVDPVVAVGRHVLTVSAAATGRYAPSLASAPLEITRVVPLLDMQLPHFILIPGALNFKGRVHSVLGPIDGTPVKLSIGKSVANITSEAGGVLSGRVPLGMNPGIFGSQDLTVLIAPAEPWYAPLTVTRPILVVNVVNGSGIIVVFVVLGMYLPARLRRRLGGSPPKKSLPRPEPLPESSATIEMREPTPDYGGSAGGPEGQVAYWYRRAAHLVASIARVALKPQQTLREFALECQRVLGPAAVYFMTLTRLLERILYSRYPTTAEDVAQSKQLSLIVKERIGR